MIVLRCDGCGATTPAGGDKQVGWLQIRCFTDEEEKGGWMPTSTTHLEVVGHCCSIACLGSLALAQNDDLAKELVTGSQR